MGKPCSTSCPTHPGLDKVDVCRVDTCLTYANGGLWAMVDGELFLPEEWFGAAFAQRRTELGIPAERRFETKIQLGLKMVKRVKGHGLPFDLLACDALYGRDSQFRADVDAEGVRYAAQVPADTLVYLSEPRVGLPPIVSGSIFAWRWSFQMQAVNMSDQFSFR